MNLNEILLAFSELGNRLRHLHPEKITQINAKAIRENEWFTEKEIKRAFEGLLRFLDKRKLEKWIRGYDLNPHIKPVEVGIAMAGNIPAVGFHDLLCVLIAGHNVCIKPSNKDSVIIKFLVSELASIHPDFKRMIRFSSKLEGIHALIATGSDNTARYFKYNFGNVPSLIRKNRTGVAVLGKNNVGPALKLLADDVFAFYGLGCRNISKLFISPQFPLEQIIKAWSPYEYLLQNKKYANNYKYQSSIAAVEKVSFLDTGFCLLMESEKLVSPVSVIFFEFYENKSELNRILNLRGHKIQLVASTNRTFPGSIPIGSTQSPELWDYADNVDTLKFITSL